MSQGAGLVTGRARPPVWRQAAWWIADYVYAGRRQLAIFAFPWSVGWPRRVPVPWRTGSPDLPEVVLVPGVYEHWTFLRPLGDALSAAGHRVNVVHGLGSNRRSITETAERLGRVLADDPGPGAGRVLVAHSKGGLIGKHLLVDLAGDPEAEFGVIGLVTVCTPFAGSRRARLFFDPTIRAFLPNDATIVSLGRSTGVNARIVSVFGPWDPHIPEGSALDGATNVEVDVAGHFRPLGHAVTHKAVIEGIAHLVGLQRAQPGAPHPNP